MSFALAASEVRQTSRWSRVLRFVLLGPLVGALVAISHTVVGVVVWVQHGEPDFYFRGWGDVEPALLLGAVLGTIKGIPLAVVLILFEWLARRRIRIVWFTLCICAIAAAASIVTVTIEFERQKLLGFHSVPESIALWLGVLVGPLLSRKHAAFGRRRAQGISLDQDGCWEVSPPGDVCAFIRHLPDLMPCDAILYLEGCSMRAEVTEKLEELRCEPQAVVAVGTLWPKPRCVHIPVTEQNLRQVAALFDNYAAPEICHHLHVYKNNRVLLEWHDAFFNDPFFVSKQIPEAPLKAFCGNVGSRYKKCAGFEKTR